MTIVIAYYPLMRSPFSGYQFKIKLPCLPPIEGETRGTKIENPTEVDSAFMEPIPLPSPIHYELLLQLLERQTMIAVNQNPKLHSQVNQLIITLRKAAAQQKQLEESCKLAHIQVESRWSLNHVPESQASSRNSVPLGQKPPM